jgi:hypothetical protein
MRTFFWQNSDCDLGQRVAGLITHERFVLDTTPGRPDALSTAPSHDPDIARTAPVLCPSDDARSLTGSIRERTGREGRQQGHFGQERKVVIGDRADVYTRISGVPVDDEYVPQVLQAGRRILRIVPGFPYPRFPDHGGRGRAESGCIEMSAICREAVDHNAGESRGPSGTTETGPSPGRRKRRLFQGDFVGGELAAGVPAHPEAVALGSLEKGFSGGRAAERWIDDHLHDIVRQRDWAVDLRLKEGVDRVAH